MILQVQYFKFCFFEIMEKAARQRKNVNKTLKFAQENNWQGDTWKCSHFDFAVDK